MEQPTTDHRIRSTRLVLLAALVACACVSVGVAGAGPASAAAAVRCIRDQTPPKPPAGGAVFARSMDAGSAPNVVEIPAGETWTDHAGAGCADAKEVMTHPTTIAVGAGGAVLLDDQPKHLVSAWGATTTDANSRNPSLFPGRADWTTTEAQTVDPEELLEVYDSCRDCSLGDVHFRPVQPRRPDVAFAGDVTGADLQGARLEGDLSKWNLSNANLTGANLSDTKLVGAVLDRTIVNRVNFDRTDLRGAKLTALRFRVAPSFTAVRIGPSVPDSGDPRDCTVFTDTDLLHAQLSVSEKNKGCIQVPLLPGSTVRLSLLSEAIRRFKASQIDFGGAIFLAGATDRADLAGQNLTGINLTGVHFIGFPADLRKTVFTGDRLAGASFDLADLSGATFDNASLTGASLRGADLDGAKLTGTDTNLTHADLIDADISGASFVGANLSGAVLSHVLAQDTDFNGVRAPKATFTDAHIYGNGRAFDSATNLQGADFSGAILAGDTDEGGGFDFTHADLTNATFDGAQCIGCNFTGATLRDVHFIAAYLPGSIFAGVQTLSGAQFHDAWLYCGRNNGGCKTDGGSGTRWNWVLELGSGEDYGPVPFGRTNLEGVRFDEVATCPDGKAGRIAPAGCDADDLLPAEDHAPTIPAPCSAVGPGSCPTPTSTLLDSSSLATGPAPALLSATPAKPTTWATPLTGRGLYAGFGDATIRLIEGRDHPLVAGRSGDRCRDATASCGDGGPATDARLGQPAGLAVGLDGSLYIADPELHRVRRIDPSGQITTVAGDGRECGAEAHDCGNGGSATAAKLAGPYGVWVDPSGEIYIADGPRGVREVTGDGQIVSAGAGDFDVRSVVGSPAGDLYAATDRYLLRIAGADRKVTKVVGTGTNGYNGNKDTHGALAPGSAVQVNDPAGLSVAQDGDVLFADSANNLIRAYVPSSGHVINALAGVVDNGKPQGGFNDDGRLADQTKLSDPRVVAALPAGKFDVVDAGNNRIRRLGPSDG